MTTGALPASRTDEPDTPRRPELFENTAPGGQPEEKTYTIETDVQLRGGCSLDAYRLHQSDADGQPKLQLTVRYLRRFHPADLADQFVALASLLTGRRFEWTDATNVVGRRTVTERDSARPNPVDPYLGSGTADLGELSDWYKRLLVLTPDTQWRVLFGAYMYQQAALGIETRPDTAFLNLVTAIEAVSGTYRLLAAPTLPDVDCRLAQLVSKVDSPDLRRRLTDAILGRERFIRRRFVAFVCDHVEHDELWPLVAPQDFGGQARRLLPRLVGSIYDERSHALHDGRPFPMVIRWPHFHTHSRDYPGAKESAVEFWSRKGVVPPVAFIERLVHHVLRQYLLRVTNREQVPESSPGADQGAA